MSTKLHTPITTGAVANAATFNSPLGQIDAAVGDLATLTTTAKTDVVSAINELDATKQDTFTSQTANQVLASPNGSAGTPGFRSLVSSDLPNSGARSGTFTKVTVNQKGVVTSGTNLTVSDISDIATLAVDTLGATTDNTNNNVSITKHGFFPKLVNDATQIFNGIGAWVKWAMGVKYNGSGTYTPRSFINFNGAGVSVQDDPANDSIKVTISGIAGGVQTLATLTDVSLASSAQNEVLTFNASSQLWENKNISSFIPTGHIVASGGSSLTNRPTMNFGGTGLTAVDNSANNRTDITVNAPASASTSVEGLVALATGVQTTGGSITNLAVTPDGLAGSIFGVKGFSVQIVEPSTDVDTTSGVFYYRIPQCFNGMNLLRAQAFTNTAGITNATTIQVRNMTKYASNDALSTAISIASGGTVGTAGTVNASYDDVSTDDQVKIYVPTNSTTKPKGLMVTLEYQLP